MSDGHPDTAPVHDPSEGPGSYTGRHSAEPVELYTGQFQYVDRFSGPNAAAHAMPGHQAQVASASEPRERVGLGLLAALVAVFIGVVLTVVVWRAGYIASITSLVIAAGAIWVYSLVAGSAPRRGLIPLILLVVVGVVASFFAVIGSDLVAAYDQLGVDGTGVSRTQFVINNIFDAELLRRYSHDMGLFALFAVLGVFGTLRRLFARG
jgi:hypothetical protein